MADFSVEAKLGITLDERDLRQAKHRLESEIGSTSAGTVDAGSMSAQTARGGGGRARRRARQSFRMEQERTNYLDESVTYLEEIEDQVSNMSPGGGSYGDDITGALFETGGDAAIEAGSTLADFGVETLGTAIGTTIGNLFGNGDGSSDDTDQPDSPLLKKPDWVPIQLSKPAWTPIAIENPQAPYPLENPPAPYPLEEPQEPYPVEDVPPIEVEVTVDGPGNVERGPAPNVERQTDPNGNLTRETGTGGSGTTSMLDAMTKGTKVGGPFGALLGASGYAANVLDSDTEAGPIVDGDEQGLFGSSNPAPSEGQVWKDNLPASFLGGTMSNRPQSTSQPSQPTVESGGQNVEIVDRSTTKVIIEAQADELADEVVDALERQYGDRVDDIEDDVRELESELNNLESSLRTGR